MMRGGVVGRAPEERQPGFTDAHMLTRQGFTCGGVDAWLNSDATGVVGAGGVVLWSTFLGVGKGGQLPASPAYIMLVELNV